MSDRLYRRAWDGRPYEWPPSAYSDDGNFFLFVEDVMVAGPGELLDPHGNPIGRDVRLGKQPWQFRSSGIQIANFLEVMDRFEPLDHDNVTDDQRRRRRDQLLEYFGGTPLPLLDLFVSEKDEELPFLRAILTPGAWYWVAVRRRENDDQRLPIFVGAPELGEGPYLPGSLAYIDAIPPYIEYRLRDIFSLVHISDAGIEEGGGEPTPPPDRPFDGPDLQEGYLERLQTGFDEGSAKYKEG